MDISTVWRRLSIGSLSRSRAISGVETGDLGLDAFDEPFEFGLEEGCFGGAKTVLQRHSLHRTRRLAGAKQLLQGFHHLRSRWRGLGPEGLAEDGKQPCVKPGRSDDGLVEHIARAHLLMRKLTDGSGRTIADVADAAAIHVADVSRILPLAFLAPSITDAILRGRQPVELTSRALMRDVGLPALWSDQLRHLRM